jgi:serine phosphatase RsbU (regulator of sigma subunit)
VKGDKSSIGGFGFYKDKGFTSFELSFDPGDAFYLFTDGFPDQFGGKKGKKMMTKKFIRMLESTQHFIMLEQERVINEWFDKWKGDNEQTDDVLLIGIRF